MASLESSVSVAENPDRKKRKKAKKRTKAKIVVGTRLFYFFV